VPASEAEVRALTVLGADLAYLGRGEEGVARLRESLRLAERIGDHLGLERAYVNLTDVLTMLGRCREAVHEGRAGLDAMRRYGIDSTLLVANQVEALLAIGEWDDADRLSAAALRGGTCASLVIRADLELGRGDFAAARAHLDAARAGLREDRALGRYDSYLVELALGERRWADAEVAAEQGLTQATGPAAAPLRVQLCADALRAQAELAALDRARRDTGTVRRRLARAGKLIAVARGAAASATTPVAAGWLAVAEAEHERVRRAAPAAPPAAGQRPGPGATEAVQQPGGRGGGAGAGLWEVAAAVWVRLDRPALVAYCRWREAEALVEAGASRARAGAPLRAARVIAARLGAGPLLDRIDLLAGRARLDLSPVDAVREAEPGLAEQLGLTPREAEVLALLARGRTNREIAATLVISVRTAGVHVSHILGKLGAPNRQAAAALADRLRTGPEPGPVPPAVRPAVNR
jgi:DNA-binding CsgD family transcriptional regulator